MIWQDSPTTTLDTPVGQVALRINSATRIYVECKAVTMRGIEATGNVHLHFHKAKWEPIHTGDENWKCGQIFSESTYLRHGENGWKHVPDKTRDAMVRFIVVAVNEWAAQNEAVLYDAESIKENNEALRCDGQIEDLSKKVEEWRAARDGAMMRAAEARNKRDAALATKIASEPR